MITVSSQLRNYVIDSEIGRGAFGVVYKGHLATQPETQVAIKVLENTGSLEQQMAEPEMLSRLQHENIVRMREYFVDNDQLVIVLDFISGGDLRTALENGRHFTDNDVKQFLRSMGDALAYAHHRNIVHRDIKLANIMIDDRVFPNRFILTDFGIGRVAEGVQDRPNTGGTFLFMAPEQFRGRPVPQSDLWAVGVVAYRMLSGKMPFAGNNLQELSRSILYSTVVAPSVAAARSIDSNLDLLVSQLLEKSLNERVSSAEELSHLLAGHAEDGYGATSRLMRTGDTLIQSFVGTVFDSAAEKQESGMDRFLRTMRRRQKLVLVAAIVFGTLIIFSSGPISGITSTIGFVLFALSQTRKSHQATRYLALGCLFLLTGWISGSIYNSTSRVDTTVEVDQPADVQKIVDKIEKMEEVSQQVGEAVARASDPTQNTSPELSLRPKGRRLTVDNLWKALGQISYPLFGLALIAHRRINRKIANCSLLVVDPNNTTDHVEKLKRSVAQRPNDILFRLKYVEAMLAANQLEDVIVECQMILEIDPFNFNANLLLANALVELGLFDDAAQVCGKYLKVSGYCFEFQMLLDRCRNRGSNP